MSPWTILAWITLAVIYVAAGYALRLMGKVWNWSDWLAPAIIIGIPVMALLFALIKRLLSPQQVPPAVTPGMQAVTPAMASMMPPREIAKRWDDFLPLLGNAGQPVFLSLGEADALRSRLWLSTPESRYLRDDVSGLAFAIFPESLWIDVPGSFVDRPESGPGTPPPAGGPPGLWEELIRFLPRLPGSLCGVLLFVDSSQPSETAAGAGSWLAGKLNTLYAKCERQPPSLWITAARLEYFPGGRRLVEKIAASGDGGRLLLNEALGVTPARPASPVTGHAFAACVEKLADELDGVLLGFDSGAQNDNLSPEVHLLRESLPDIGRNAKLAVDCLSKAGSVKKAPFGGVFLCGDGRGGAGVAFAASLPRSVIPARSRRIAAMRPGKTGYVLAWLVLAILAVGLYATYVRAKACVDDIPFHLLDPAPNPGSFGGSPPVARYARARETLNALGDSHRLAKIVYHAPQTGIDKAETLFAHNLESWLPNTHDSGLMDRWLDDLSDWVEHRKGVRNLTFSTLSNRTLATVRGAHSRSGRAAAAALLADWRILLDVPSRRKIDLLQKSYDDRVYDDWRRKGGAILANTLAAAETDDFAVTTDFLASDPGFVFAAKAGDELDFDNAEPNEWARAAVAIARTYRESLRLKNGPETPSWLDTAVQMIEHGEQYRVPRVPDTMIAAARRMNDYKASLAAVYPRCLDQSALAALAADTYSPPGGNPPPPTLARVNVSRETLEKAFVAMDPVFAGGMGRETLSLLESGYELALRAATVQAAHLIQKEWEKEVLSPLSVLDDDAALVFMLDNNPLHTFLNGTVEPFFDVEEMKLVPAVALDREFPFIPASVEWLNRARVTLTKLDKEYPIQLTLLPVTTSQSAGIYPRGLGFTLESAKEPFTLVGYNNKATSSFTWSPRTSLGVELLVFFDTFHLETKYPGALGWVDFLQRLDNGKLVLSTSAFPDRRQELERCGVYSITAHFQIVDQQRSGEIDAVLPALPQRFFPVPIYAAHTPEG